MKPAIPTGWRLETVGIRETEVMRHIESDLAASSGVQKPIPEWDGLQEF